MYEFYEFLFLILVLAPIIISVLSIVAFVRTRRLAKNQTELANTLSYRLGLLEEKIDELSSGNAPSSKVVAEDAPSDTVSEQAPTEETSSEALEIEEKETSDQEEEPRDELPEAARDETPSGPWDVSRSANQNEAPKEDQPIRSGLPQLDLESMLGGRWSVLLGGFTLALGIVFLVRHSIEAGYLGPGPRVIIGLLLSALILAAGEWLRRSDRDFGLPVYQNADVPGILTGAGACGAFGALYAAHGLYGFIGPGTAFIALTLVGIGALVLSTIHGPILAAIGVLGAYGTPLLVSSNDPNTLALALHVLVVTAAVLGIAHFRDWRWLAIAGFVASSIWTGIAAMPGGNNAGISGALLIVGLAAIFSILFYIREEDNNIDATFEKSAGLAFALLVIACILHLIVNSDLPATATVVCAGLLITGIAITRPSTAPVALISSVLTVFGVLASDVPRLFQSGLLQTVDYVPRDINSFVLNAFILALQPSLLSLWAARRRLLSAPRTAAWLATAISFTGFFGVLASYLRISPFETKPLIGAVALGVAAGLALLTELFIRIKPDNHKAPAPAAFAVGAVATASLAISISLDVGWMPLAFALTALGIAFIYSRRPVSTLPWLATLATAICGLTLYANMPLELPGISETLLINELIALLAVPAAAILLGAEMLRKAHPTPNWLTHGLMTSAGLALAALFVALEIIHIINNGNLQNVRHSLAETAGLTLAALGFAIGLQFVAKRSDNPVFNWASMVAGIVGIAYAAFGLFMLHNPALEKASIGTGLLINLLLPAYLLTGLASAAVALLSRSIRPRWYTLGYAALSGALLFTYFSLMLRHYFQGETVDLLQPTSDLEFWLYSPLWLVLGAIILAVGLRLNSQPVRLASALLIGLTIVKVFLLDMASLEGLLRAASFIGLGISLIVIGRFYQRILTRKTART
ncbi:MAG: DUF2339 domain-containing protein [Rhizobiaceae bacterium]|nr:DUF2339 domain-containing protein [Rhizobiaceae bacterium]